MWLCSAIAVLLSLGSTTLAQGNIGGSQASCAGSNVTWNYRGCYNDEFGISATRHAGMNWQLRLNSDVPSQSYPGYTGTITVLFCQQACRGHGFRFAALYTGAECYCASAFPNPQPPTSGSTTSGPGALPPNTNPGAAVDISYCNSRCTGDATQFCGGSTYAAVYEDPSFSSDTSLQSPAYYGYLGCYQTASPGNLYVALTTTSTISCETYCGRLGYPYSARLGIDTDTFNTCGCGTEIQAGYQLPADTPCRYACNGGAAP